MPPVILNQTPLFFAPKVPMLPQNVIMLVILCGSLNYQKNMLIAKKVWCHMLCLTKVPNFGPWSPHFAPKWSIFGLLANLSRRYSNDTACCPVYEEQGRTNKKCQIHIRHSKETDVLYTNTARSVISSTFICAFTKFTSQCVTILTGKNVIQTI